MILNGDCLEVMKTLPDKSIDLFLCDLPYGCLSSPAGVNRINSKGEIRTNEAGKIGNMGCAWDIKIDLVKFWEQVKRLAKDDHTPVIHFCNARYGFELYNSNPDWFRYDLIWSKPKATGFLMANKQPMSSHEHIYVFAKKGATYYRKDIEGNFPKSHSRGYTTIGNTNTYNGGKPLPFVKEVDNTGKRCVKSVIEIAGKKSGNHHPTQKPDELYKFLIERYSKEGDTILDPTAGSFSSVFIAEKLGRTAIGIEMDETFYNKAILKLL